MQTQAWSVPLMLVLLGQHGNAQACSAISDSVTFKRPAEVKTMVDAGTVTLLDARSNFSNHIDGSVEALWHDGFTAGNRGTSLGGILANIPEIKQRFAELGVSPAKTVVVYGTWQNGWGDEGRIQWMLKYVGHPNAYILQGGVAAYLAAYPSAVNPSGVSSPSPVALSLWDSGLSPMASISVTKTDLSTGTAPLLIDTRTLGEYDGTAVTTSGAAMYGVARLGHPTDAVSFPFSEFFSDGCLVTCDAFTSKLVQLGWTEGRKIVSYCTAGIRSAFFWAVSAHCGISDSANYGGSMWDYAADNSLSMTTIATVPVPQTSTVPPTETSQAWRVSSVLASWFPMTLLVVSGLVQ